MKISVVLPAYNEEKYIRGTLEAFKKQTVIPDEIIVVDNNCTDNTVAIAKACGAKVIREEKQGIIYARNTGFNAAHNEIIARTDCDTIVPSTWIEDILRDFTEDRDLVAISGPVQGDSIVLPSKILVSVMGMVNRFCVGHYLLYGPNMAIRKETWDKMKDTVCLDNSKVHEDFDLGIHLGKYGKIYYDKKLGVTASSRRFKNTPTSFLVEYPLRWARTLITHRNLFSRGSSLKN